MQLMANLLANLFIFCIFLVFVLVTIPVILINFAKECVLVVDKFLVRNFKLLKQAIFRTHKNNS